MLELNPSITQNVEIVSKTDVGQLNSIGIFSKKTDKKIVDSVFRISENIDKSNKYKNMSEMLEYISLYKIDINDLNDLILYYDEYFKLKEKYN